MAAGPWRASPAVPPTARFLDALVPDRPVFLPNRDHHGAWVNSRALELAGIDARTPDPVDGRIERDARRRARPGMLQEGAMELVAAHLPGDHRGRAPGRAAPRPGPAALARHHRLAGRRSSAPRVRLGDVAGAYRAAVTKDLLTARVVGALWWERDQGLEQVDELLARPRAS